MILYYLYPGFMVLSVLFVISTAAFFILYQTDWAQKHLKTTVSTHALLLLFSVFCILAASYGSRLERDNVRAHFKEIVGK